MGAFLLRDIFNGSGEKGRVDEQVLLFGVFEKWNLGDEKERSLKNNQGDDNNLLSVAHGGSGLVRERRDFKKRKKGTQVINK